MQFPFNCDSHIKAIESFNPGDDRRTFGIYFRCALCLTIKRSVCYTRDERIPDSLVPCPPLAARVKGKTVKCRCSPRYRMADCTRKICHWAKAREGACARMKPSR